MKFFDKKILIILFFLFIIIFTSIYFFTQDNTYEFIPQNELYVSEEQNSINNTESLIIIHVDGEVVNPGIVSIPINSRIQDAIFAAGGLTNLADTSKINLAYLLKDGQKIYIPSIYDFEKIIYIQNDAGNNVIVPDIQATSVLININFATQSELESLPNVGASTASKIIDYRNKNGNFKTLEDIMNVSGIGESKFNSIKDFICI